VTQSHGVLKSGKGHLTSRWIGPGMRGAFGVIVPMKATLSRGWQRTIPVRRSVERDRCKAIEYRHKSEPPSRQLGDERRAGNRPDQLLSVLA
jgi:hypothetical protein